MTEPSPTVRHATAALGEADRLMTVCNACRYCEGLCPVFPAMEMRRSFGDGDLHYLANLCHGCGACYIDCQFAPPHAFDVNVPRALAVVRAETYRAYAWPAALAPLFDRNGLAVSLIGVACVTAFMAGFVVWHDAQALFGVHTGPGAFYRLLPHAVMAWLFGAAFLYAVLAMAFGARSFWRAAGAAGATLREPRALAQAIRAAGTLRHLDGGGAGCFLAEDAARDRRRLFHHLTLYGFLLCLASTTVATLYHYVAGREAPYPWYDLPVVLGTLGGLGLVAGPAGLLVAKWRRAPELDPEPRFGMGTAFLVMLMLTSLTGLALLVLRATPAMGLLLALHLGVVLGLFITMPYGKFVHGLYRLLALVRYAREAREPPPGGVATIHS